MLKKFKDLTVAEQHRRAWEETLSRVYGYSLIAAGIIFGLLAAVGLLWVGINTIDYLASLPEPFWRVHPALSSIALAIVLSALGLLTYKRIVFYELSRENKIMVHPWCANKGSVPKYKCVNAQYLDGTVVWNKVPETLDWDLKANNPIVEYMIKG
jgi:hypothetical protein